MSYRINEIFYSIQGEGVRAGTANVFVRFTGCNLQCAMEAGPKSPGGFDCDTEFTSGRAMTAAEVVEEALLVGGECRSVIFTGGEPSLQLDAEMLRAFDGWFRCIETNGSRKLEAEALLEWVTVSPKVAEHAVRQLRASEVKYVRGYGQDVPVTDIQAEHYLVSPAFAGDEVDRRALGWCIDLVKKNPKWRLSVQQHKGMRIR